MRTWSKKTLVFVAGLALLVMLAGTARADGSSDARLKALEKKVQQQGSELQRLKKKLSTQNEKTSALSSEIDSYVSKASDEGWWSEPNTLRAYWAHGLRFASSDKQFSLAIGGRLMYDVAVMDPDSDLEAAYPDKFHAQGEFRRVRMYMAGNVYGNADYKCEMDFAGAKVTFKDVFVGVHGSFGSIHIGHQYEPIGLENLTSDNYITFIERATILDPMIERTTGIRYDNTFMDGKVSVAGGWFFSEQGFNSNGQSGNGVLENNFTGRVTWAPILLNKGEQLLHLGAGVSFRNPRQGKYSFSMHPEVHVAPTVVGADFSDLEDATIVNLEAAYTTGPFSAQAEYAIATTKSSMYNDPTLNNFYIAANYFLTGEHRTYSKGTFGRIAGPNKDFLKDGGLGAWQVGARYSYTDLNDKDLRGGKLSNVTVGVNWYLNPNVRFMFDFVHSDIKNSLVSSSTLNAFYVRFAVDW